jgi:hypothetical protein
MNCFEALQGQLRECEPCWQNLFIVEFEDLPGEHKLKCDYYEKEKHFLVYCQKCEHYQMLGD